MNKIEVQTLRTDQYKLWDAFVDQSPQGDVFCYHWWLEAITKSNFKILAILENDEIVAGIPLALDTNNKINVPPLTRTLGVLYKNQDYQSGRKQISTERKWLSELLKYLPLDDFVQMCMHHNFKDWLPFRWNGFCQTTRYTYILNYENKTLDDLWNNVDAENRRIIKRATENGIRIEITDNFDLIYHCQSLSLQRQGLKLWIPYNDIKLLDEAVVKRGNRIIFKAIDNMNQVHAALYIAFNKRSAYDLMDGSDTKFRNLGSHTLLLWEAVKYFRDKVEYFNFGGSDIQQIEKYIKGFGGTLTPYFHIFNEKLLRSRVDIRYHLTEASLHLIEVLKIVKNRILKIIRY
jgi:hypothetical protein